MKERVFKEESARIEALTRIDSPNAEYWRAYQRGLRRSHLGEKFGTEEMHQRWLAMARSRDPFRAVRGRGYLEGLAAGV